MSIYIKENEGELLVQAPGGQIKTAFQLAICEGVAVIVDTTDCRPLTSVTNSAAIVIPAIKHHLQHLPEMVIYRDTEGNWDRLMHNGVGFTGFTPIKAGVITNELTVQEAVALAQSTLYPLQ